MTPDGVVRVSVKVEIADSLERRDLGLMYRDSLDPGSGMLFVYPDAGVRRFWMKNTKVPLDMAFADGRGRIVGIVANTQPFSETLVGPDAPAQYILEVEVGFCARHAVSIGDRFQFLGFAPQAAD